LSQNGEIPIDQRANVEFGDRVEAAAIGPLDLKGLEKPVETYRLIAVAPS
jgi:hypothetical protein